MCTSVQTAIDREGRVDDDHAACLVAHLSLVVVTCHLGVEGDALGRVVEVDVLEELHRWLRGPFCLGERCHILRVSGIVVA